MYLLEIIPLTKIPPAQSQILTYFSGASLPPGALVLIPLGKRKESGVILNCELLEKNKMEIKKADFELRNISRIISYDPLLTKEQLELALWLGQYYFAPPGVFLKMALPKTNGKKQIAKNNNSGNLSSNGQKLIITPTIALAANLAAKEPNALFWHSGLSPKKQNEIWWKIKNNEIGEIIGTRSAVFLPFYNLKEIIIEDESNSSHKSWDMWPHWRTHEAARKLTDIFQSKLTFKSEFPSVEYYFYNKYQKIIENGHHNFEIIDLRQEIKEGNFSLFSRRLRKLIGEALEQKKQIILFSHRRGTANFILCRDCGYTTQCPNCEVPLAYHLINGRPNLFCHRCGFIQPPPSFCPQCQSWQLKTAGAGAQKTEAEAIKLFPKAKIARLDSDTTPKTGQQKKIIESFLKKEIDILVATPILLSWKTEFKKARPEITALISAETIFHLPDFRAGEKALQIIKALADLTERYFLIQTKNPENQILNYAAKNQWPEFFEEELSTRRILNYPPFSQLVKITFRHPNPQKAGQEAKILKIKIDRTNKNKDIEISEALPAFIPKEKGKYVWNIVIKFKIADPCPQNFNSEFLAARNSLLKFIPSNFEIDVDPTDLL